MLATSRCNGIWKMIRHNRLLPAPTYYVLVAHLLRGRYGETGVMDFGKTCNGEVAKLLWSCYGEVANLLQTCYRRVVYIADLLATGKSPTCYVLATGKLV